MLSPRVGGQATPGEFDIFRESQIPYGGGGGSHMKGTLMLVRKFELNPKEDQSGRGSGFIGPLKETMLKQTAK